MYLFIYFLFIYAIFKEDDAFVSISSSSRASLNCWMFNCSFDSSAVSINIEMVDLMPVRVPRNFYKFVVDIFD